MDAVHGPPVSGLIRFLTGPLAGTSYQITKSVITIGREPTNDIVISDPSISRHHAQLSYINGSWSIKKVSPQNILTVNQRNVSDNPLQDRDTIGLGTGTTFLMQLKAAGGGVNQSMGPQGVVPVQRPPIQKQVQTPAVAPPPPIGAPPPQSFGSTHPAWSTSGLDDDAHTQRSSLLPIGGGPNINGGVPELEVSSNTDHERVVYALTQPVIDIGRDPSNTIVINRPTVSSFHAQIIREGNQLVLLHPHPKREKTLNGIDYNGTSISGTTQFREVLKRGDVIRISDESGTFVSLAFNDGSGAPQEVIPEIRPIPLGAALITLGRLPDNNVVLNHPQVSGHHARLEQTQGGYRITDLGSTNHVYVNAQRISHQILQPGDEVRIGPFKLTYTGTQLTQQDESNGIRIDALHLKKAGNKQVILLDDISLAIPPRKFVALVGGSGAGKSTLMDALNGLRPAQQGAVLYNGQDYYHHLAAFSTQLGYVPQDDIIHRDLPVERALYYAAKLRLPSDFTEKQIKQRIEDVLDDVEMKFRRKLLVSKLSGGQRKRVSIALELLANPSVFFLDEPTSGLDPGLDRKMMLLLRKLADKGHTIVLVTHATNNINACDYICFLAQGGHMAYFGPPNEAKTYFGKTDFAEIYSALEPTEEHPDIPAEAEARFKQSPDFQRYVVQPLQQGPAGKVNTAMQTEQVTPAKRGNPWKQFRLLALRYLELLKNDKGNLAILLLQAPVIGIILFFLASGGTFDRTSIANCPLGANPTVAPATQQDIRTHDCQRVVDLLNGPQGPQFEAQKGKSANQILQDAVAPGAGGDAQKILFIMAFAAVMFGCINGAREIVKEAPVYQRERAVNLGIAPYMFSKIVVLGVLCLVQSLILVVAVYTKAPIHRGVGDNQQGIIMDPAIETYITLALTSLAGLMVGLTVSALAPNNDRATSLIPILLIPQVIFSGIIFPLNNPLMQFLGTFFAARWAMAGMGSTVGLHGDKLGGDTFSFQGVLFSGIPPDRVAATFHLLLIWFILIAMIIILGLATAYFLKKKDVRS
jgi:ABC-type multidrug transport system ATPase subunit/pSer/pThr/pTyr-binding forkhead associated (FHA) protein